MEREFYIAGVQHHESHEVMDLLKKGILLHLEPEPTNQYDSNAIKIMYSSQNDYFCMLGYVPAKFAAEVGAAMTINDTVSCTITELNPTNKPWERIKVIIKGEDNE